MRRFLLILFVICAVMWVPAESAEPKIVREIAVVPCEGNPLYIFVFDTGSVALFDLRRASEDADTRKIFMALLERAKQEVTKKEVVLRQNCPREGVST